MRIITLSLPVSKSDERSQVKGQHTGTFVAINVKDELDRFELTDGQLLGTMTDNTSSKYLMLRELHSALEASGIGWPALRNHIPFMAHARDIDLGAFLSTLGVQGRTKTWKAHEGNQQYGENESIDIGKSHRLRTEGNARINKVSAM
jgi:hypothetical protein